MVATVVFTVNEQDILDFLRTFEAARGYGANVGEIAVGTRQSVAAAHRILARLYDKGVLLHPVCPDVSFAVVHLKSEWKGEL